MPGRDLSPSLLEYLGNLLRGIRQIDVYRIGGLYNESGGGAHVVDIPKVGESPPPPGSPPTPPPPTPTPPPNPSPPPPDPDPDPPPPGGIEQGVYKPPESESAYRDWENFTGTSLGFIKKHTKRTTGRSAWATGPAGGYPSGAFNGRRLMVNLAPFSGSNTAPQGTNSQVANGDWDSDHADLADHYIANGHSDAILCLAHEMNFANGYPWAFDANGSSLSIYINMWRHVHGIWMGRPGANFEWAWTVGRGGSIGDLADIYPGDAYVDYIGMDFYDSDPQYKPSQGGNWYTNRWNKFLSMDHGLNWLTSFAATHSKSIVFPEFGLQSLSSVNQNGGGDNVDFIEDTYDWFTSHNVTHIAYHEINNETRSHYIEGSQFPNAKARFAQLY